MLLIKCAILRPEFISGVSNTWPAWCDCAARVIIKNLKIWMKLHFYVVLSTFNPLLRPADTFLLLVRHASSYFDQMRPSNRFEFETPALYCRRTTFIHFKAPNGFTN